MLTAKSETELHNKNNKQGFAFLVCDNIYA